MSDDFKFGLWWSIWFNSDQGDCFSSFIFGPLSCVRKSRFIDLISTNKTRQLTILALECDWWILVELSSEFDWWVSWKSRRPTLSNFVAHPLIRYEENHQTDLISQFITHSLTRISHVCTKNMIIGYQSAKKPAWLVNKGKKSMWFVNKGIQVNMIGYQSAKKPAWLVNIRVNKSTWFVNKLPDKWIWLVSNR